MTGSDFNQIRIDLGLDQEELAEELGYNRATITRYENGSLPIPLRAEKALKLLVKVKGLAA